LLLEFESGAHRTAPGPQLYPDVELLGLGLFIGALVEKAEPSLLHICNVQERVEGFAIPVW